MFRPIVVGGEQPEATNLVSSTEQVALELEAYAAKVRSGEFPMEAIVLIGRQVDYKLGWLNVGNKTAFETLGLLRMGEDMLIRDIRSPDPY